MQRVDADVGISTSHSASPIVSPTQPVDLHGTFAHGIGDPPAPAGTFVATILDIKDEFGVQRPKYGSDDMETVDLTCFLFGYRDQQGVEHKITSKRMRISGHPKSNLFGFLNSLLGHAPQYGWDYCTLKGAQCLISVKHVQHRSDIVPLAVIASICPLRTKPNAADMPADGMSTTAPTKAGTPVVDTPAQSVQRESRRTEGQAVLAAKEDDRCPLQSKIVGPAEWQEIATARERPSSGDGRHGDSENAASLVVAVDFETFYTSDYSVSRLGTWAYVHDERFNAYLVAVSDGRHTCVCHPSAFPWESIANRAWCSHNRDFDRAVFRRLNELGVIDVQESDEWHCTAAMAAFLQLPRSLAGAAREAFGIELDKEVRKRCSGLNPGESVPDDVLMYAARDAAVCAELWIQLGSQWPEYERRLFELTSDMGAMGLEVDWEYVEAKRRELNDLLEGMADELPWTPALSIKKFREACVAAGVPPPKSTSASEPSFLMWLEEHADSDPAIWVQCMQRIRSANRMVKALESMEARRMGTDPSGNGGRMAYELKYFGAATGRWSGGGGLNLQNLNRKAVEGVDLRRCIIPAPGKVLGVVDYAQIESRVLLFLAGDVESLEMFRANPDADAYEIHARATMGYAEPEPLREYCERTGSMMRQLAKARVLGLGFSCGSQRFVELAKAMTGLEISEQESERIVREFRVSNPLIVSLWRRLNDACAACAGGTYTLPLPSTQYNAQLKRYLLYREVSVDRDGIECTVCGKRVKVYGGLLAENWTQATARDVLAGAWLRCVEHGYVPILSVHDELVFELDEATAEADLAEIQAIMEEPLPWAMALPLRTDGKLCAVYGK